MSEVTASLMSGLGINLPFANPLAAWHSLGHTIRTPAMTVSRRTLLQTSAAAAATTAIGLSGCSEQVTAPASKAASAQSLLDQVTDFMLNACLLYTSDAADE